MSEQTLTRIADALERLAPVPPNSVKDGNGAFRWEGFGLKLIEKFAPVDLSLLSGIDTQKAALLDNSRRLSNRHAAHDVLLWGARGSGKSALVKSTTAALQKEGKALALIEVSVPDIATLPTLFSQIAGWQTPAVIFVDDLAFEGADESARSLRSILEGGAISRPPHVRLYMTSNRRHIVSRSMEEQNDPLNPRDVVDDRLALADRFGLSLGFHRCDQDQYLEMVSGYARHLDLDFDPQDALTWSTQRGARSGRIAWHYAVELAGRAGKTI